MPIIIKLRPKSILMVLTITTISIAIILSTQFIKQHVILDMTFAILLGEGIYKLVNHISLEGSLLWIKKLFWWLMTKKKLEI